MSVAAGDRVAILIVNYRAYDALERCLASVARCEPDAEVILVDHEADITRGAAVIERTRAVRYLPRADNPGFGAGVNLAASYTHSPFLLLINPDVELKVPVAAPLARLLSERPEVAIVGGRIRGTDGRVQPSARRFPDASTALGGRTSLLTRIAPGNALTRRNLGAPDGDTAETVNWVIGAFMMVRAQVFHALGGFDEGFFLYWEDTDLCRRALDAGWKTLHYPGVSVLHLTGACRRYAPALSALAFHRSAFRYHWKHGSWVARAMSPLVAVGLIGRFLCTLVSGWLFWPPADLGSPRA